MDPPLLPQGDAVAHTLKRVIDILIHRREHIRTLEPFRTISPAEVAAIESTGFSRSGRPLNEVVDQLTGEVVVHAASMDHPRMFSFVPSPATPLAWVGDLITSGFNPFSNSWLQGSGPCTAERSLMRFLADRLGLPESSGGVFVSGGSMANLTALIAARDHLLNAEDRHRAVAYVSEQTHSSVAKGLRIIGFFDEQIRTIPADAQFRLDVAALADAVSTDRAAGRRPWCVIASFGTTNTGSIDPISKIANLCEDASMWLHVDGAYGASLALCSPAKELLAGLERADSISWDPHKWLFQTYGCGLVLLRDRSLLLNSFHTRPEYLRDAESNDEQPNFWDYGIELTRPARGLKLWLTLQVLGLDRISDAIAHGLGLAETAQQALSGRPGWRLVSPAQLAIINFRFEPAGITDTGCDDLNRQISRVARAEGLAGILTTQLGGRTVLRMCAIHPEATSVDIQETIDGLDRIASELHSAGIFK